MDKTAYELLRALRKEGHTLTQIAKMVGTSDMQVCRWVNKKTGISPAWEILIQMRLKKPE